MKKYNTHNKQTLAAIILGLLTTSSSITAATYDLLDRQQNSFGSDSEQFSPLPNESSSSPSILESLQQSEINKKKSDYLEVLNLLKQNKVDEADKKVSELLKSNPNEAGFINLQALVFTIKKDLPAAEQSYQKAISLDPKNILAYLGLAKLNLEENKLDQAKEYANKGLAINDKAINAYLLLADVALKQKNTVEVENILTAALEKVKGDINAEAEIVKNLGKFYASEKQPEKILPLSEDLIKRYPNNNIALSLLAGAQLINNKKDLAEQSLRKIINNDKQDISHRLLIAQLLSEQTGKDKEVIALLDEAAKIDTNNPQANLFKAAYLIKLGRSKEALDLATKLDSQFPKLPLGKVLQGDAYLADKKLDKATAAYQKAYQQQANDKILFTIADLLSAQKKPADAIKLLNTELAKNPKNIGIHFKLATIYQQQNDYKQTENHYQAMLTEQPDNLLALNNLAWVYSQQKDPKAIGLGKKAFEKAPESAAIADTYGYILLKQGQPAEGLTILEKAAGLAPKANDIQFHLAEAYAANNNKQKALEILETIVKLEQDFSEKKAAVSLLEQLKAK
ncbi:MAG: tetratricopeptide repeat protein [Methylococcaceae bacterium]|nr:tetratricopeptide repeat protein [Methylococcaceae bacterium]MDP3902654.1 tetratricopeptide repeat protein [Methylococcaceae bacterium]